MKLCRPNALRTFVNLKLFNNKITNRVLVRCIYLTDARKRDLNHAEVSHVNETTIKEKLSSCSVPFAEGYTCFQVKNCCFCSGKSQPSRLTSSPTDIFINKRTGYFLCRNCNISGSWCTFNELIDKSQSSSRSKKLEIELIKKNCFRYDEKPDGWSNIVDSSIPLHELDTPKYLKVFQDFNLPACPKYVTENLQIRISEEKSLLYFPLLCSGNNIVGYKTYSLDGKTDTFPKNDCPGFMLHSPSKTPGVIVANIPDFLSLLSQNLSYQVLCLPYGTVNLPQSTLPFLESFEKLILWLGGVGPFDSSVNFAAKLGDKRCYIVRPIGNQLSPQIALSKNENFSLILADCKPAWHESVITFRSLREEVLAELQNKERFYGVQWKRFPALNTILKGHRRGELTVITGPTGSGKTTFMSEYSLDLAMQGVNTLWGSFEVKNSRLAKVMLQQYARTSLADNIKDFDAFADKFEQLPIFFLTFHGQHKISSVMDAIEHCSYTYDIAHVIIDNVQFMIEVTPEYQIDRFWKQDYLIQAFRNFATKNNCHVTLVMHPRKESNESELGLNSIYGGGKATQEADNVLILQSKYVTLAERRKFLQISKNRFSGDLGAIPFDFDRKNLTFIQQQSQSITDNDESQSFYGNYRSNFEKRKFKFKDEDFFRVIKNPVQLM